MSFESAVTYKYEKQDKQSYIKNMVPPSKNRTFVSKGRKIGNRKQLNEQRLGMGRRRLQLFEIGSKLNINILTQKRSLLNIFTNKIRSFIDSHPQKKVF